MAEKIKGITIQIGGDTTGLDKALKGVNTAAKGTQSELRAVEKALKLDPGNTELLEQKQRNLAAAVKTTAEKLDILKEAQRQAAEQLNKGEIGQEQYDALTREVLATEKALKDATTASDNFNISLEKAKVAAGKVADVAGTVASKTKVMSAAAGGLLTAIGGAAYNSAKTADELNTLSKQTGISTEELQKMSYASDLVDVSVDDIAGSMSKLRKNMASTSSTTQEAWETLGVSVTNADGSLRDSTEVFYDTLTALSQIGNETERDVLAMEIFGRGADSLAGIIDDGGASLQALGKEAEDLGIVLDQETLDSLNEVNDSIDSLKAKATGEIAVAGAKAMEVLTPVLDAIIEKVSALIEWIGSLDESQVKTILTITAVIAAISPVAGIISGIAGAVSTFLTIWPQVKAVGLAIKAFAAANPIVLVATAVAALAIAVAANWDKIKPILQAAWDKVKEVFENIKTKITTVIDTIAGAFTTVKETIVGIWDGIKTAIEEKINAIIGFINGLIDKVNGFLDTVGQSKIVQGIAGVFGMKLEPINNIPLLAEGGVLSSGSAIVGEAGPELLTMQNGNANVQPIANTTINNINNTSQQPVQIDLVVDRMTLARALYAPMQQVAAQHGPALVR